MSSRSGSPLGVGPLADLAALVQQRAGLVIDSSRRDVLAGMVTSRLAQLGLADPPAYVQRVLVDAAELQTLVDGLTIGETYFARIPPQIRALSELVLPQLLVRPQRRIRIWSAGCSTGEEPYTLALLLAKLLPAGGSYDLRIIGTDINSRALRSAEEGRYGARSVSLLSSPDLARYFVRDAAGWRVGDELRGMVEFRRHNLVTDPPPEQQLDLVLCRNVLIYFDRPRMLEVIETMHRALVPGGWLLLGHSETLWRLYDGLELVRHDDAFLYRRASGSAAAPMPEVTRPRKAARVSPTRPAVAQADPREGIREALASGTYSAAVKLAAAGLEQEPLAAELHYLNGLALVELGDDAQALLALRRAAYLDPALGFAQFLLGLVLGRLGHAAEAARAYAAAARSLAVLEPTARVAELGGRRVCDLAEMCRQLARSPESAAGDDLLRAGQGASR